MAASNFPASLKLVLQSEGGNDDDPQDHGGRTSRGITQREYDAWRDERGLKRLDVWKAPQSEVEEIYNEEYWLPNCPPMPTGLDYAHFNNSVLMGPYRATVLLQRALGVVGDGRLGPITRRAIAQADPIRTIRNLAIQSEMFFRGLHQPRFIKGWMNRVSFVENNALNMATKVS
jgi:lysozyme family protein